MSERTTKGHVESAFRALCKATGKREASSYNDVGAWRLDHASSYGGWNIEEITNERGGVRHPLGSKRRGNADFYDVAWFAVNAIDEMRRQS